MKVRVARLSIILLNLFFIQNLFSQTLTVSSSQLNFGNAYENAPDSLPLTIFNNMGHTVHVTGMKFYTTYGSPAFSSSQYDFSINNGSSQQVWIKFSPRHNIFHNSELVIENDGLRGYVHVDLIGQGKYSKAYYNSTQDLSEEDLKTELHVITGIGYDTLGYNIARDSMFMWLDNKRTNGQGAAQNTLECIYTGREAVGYTSRTDCQSATYNFNTEHTFPQSLFTSQEPMRSDLHHLFPTDNTANNVRADNPFGIVTNPTWSVGGSMATNTLFEPRDVHKGHAARALMYFVLRYQNYSGFFTTQEAILRTWHQNFPPDSTEKKRNEDINTIQHNRNPFVDYPQFIERINSISNFSVAPSVSSVDLTEDTIVYGYVTTALSQVFNYVIVNDGNMDINLTNFNLSNPGILTFQSGGSNLILPPGEAHVVEINLVTANSGPVHESLTFQSNVPGHANVSIPIYANDPVINNVSENLSGSIQLYPNPTKGKLFLTNFHSRILKVNIMDVSGREIKSGWNFLHSANSIMLDISTLDFGTYFLFINTDDGIVKKKFMKD